MPTFAESWHFYFPKPNPSRERNNSSITDLPSGLKIGRGGIKTIFLKKMAFIVSCKRHFEWDHSIQWN
jgi:hypothetical protein